jgi:3-oxoadipate enol-lactonase
MAFARANGAVVHFLDEGVRDAHALVFVNSLGTDFRIWDALAEPLSDKWRVVRYDKRGHGLSEWPGGAPAIADYARDLAALLDAIRVRNATIVGLSIGGLITQELYRIRPDLIDSLVLCDTAAKIGTVEMWNTRLAGLAAGGIESIADGVMERWFAQDYRAAHPIEMVAWRVMLTRTPLDAYIGACAAIRDADLRHTAASITAPTLCIVGEEDGSTPVPIVEELAGMIGRAKFEIIAGAGHIPCVEQPEIMRALVETHLKDSGL